MIAATNASFEFVNRSVAASNAVLQVGNRSYQYWYVCAVCLIAEIVRIFLDLTVRDVVTVKC